MLRIFLKAFGLDWLLPVPFQSMNVVTAHEMISTESVILLDIRKPDEWHKTGMPAGSTGIPYSDEVFTQAVIELVNNDRAKTIALSCHAGNRSREAAHNLCDVGFRNVITVEGGIIAWGKAGLPIRQLNAD